MIVSRETLSIGLIDLKHIYYIIMVSIRFNRNQERGIQMELTKMELFKAMNDKHENLKDCEGMIISPVAVHTHTYTAADGTEHSVLVIKNGKDGKFYKTEVKAFIEKFMKYMEAFGDSPDDEKPDIVIVLNQSKKGNRYVTFDLVGA